MYLFNLHYPRPWTDLWTTEDPRSRSHYSFCYHLRSLLKHIFVITMVSVLLALGQNFPYRRFGVTCLVGLCFIVQIFTDLQAIGILERMVSAWMALFVLSGLAIVPCFCFKMSWYVFFKFWPGKFLVSLWEGTLSGVSFDKPSQPSLGLPFERLSFLRPCTCCSRPIYSP